MRRLLLWSAQNRWLATHVPRWRFAQRAVRRFLPGEGLDRKSTRLNSSHSQISYAVFCLKKKKTIRNPVLHGRALLDSSTRPSYLERRLPTQHSSCPHVTTMRRLTRQPAAPSTFA